VNDHKDLEELEKHVDQTKDRPDCPEKEAEEGEFKVTVRKLEMPVRPRGVLAE
jgi:hypothetical protein